MVSKRDLRLIEPFLYEIPVSARADMRVPARLYADDYVLQMALGDRSIEQLVNTTTLPGVVGYALAMPDVHEGYGFPIGGVAATALPEGLISPGGVGYDINCGVRLLTSAIPAAALRPFLGKLMDALFHQVPSGVGAGGQLKLSESALRQVLEKGSGWAESNGYADRADRDHTEDRGCMEAADAAAVSSKALERGRNQLGTLGSGNHFLEVDEVAEIYDADAAQALGLVAGQVCFWVHSGARGLGHQVCTDAVRAMQLSMAKRHLELPDRELAGAPFSSPEGRQYYAAMCCAANYAWANRQMMTLAVRQAVEQVLKGQVRDCHLRLLYDVCHNIAKVEHHVVAGQRLELCVHRKGATRAYGPGHAALPEDYRAVGQPVLIPGNMGAGSFVAVGTDKAMRDTFGSSCHGAGRVMSRSQARRDVRGNELRAALEEEGIAVRTDSLSGLAEEAPSAYKDPRRVVEVMHGAGIVRKVAFTRPLGVMKG
jgi:tRNA-splicing ligase RtcB